MRNHQEGARGVSRRRFIGTVGAAAALGPRTLSAQGSDTFKVGVLLTFSKVFAALGEQNLFGIQLYFDQIGWQVAGRRIQLLREDDEATPQIGLQKARRLIESEQVGLLCGVQASNVALAMLNLVRQTKVPFICSGAGVSTLTSERIPNLFRTSLSSWQLTVPMGEWLVANAARFGDPAKGIVLAASDYSGGRDTMSEFKSGYLPKGGKVAKEIYPPLGTSDFSPYLADIRAVEPAAVYAFFAGSDAVRFVKQYDEFGLKGKIQLLSPGFMVENDVLPSQGSSALGVVSTMQYTDTLDTAENKDFVNAYRKKHDAFPSVYSEYGYVAARVIAEALKAVNGNTTDQATFNAAIGSVKFNAPRGPFSFDPATHNVIMNVYLREVVEQDGRFVNKVIETFKDVKAPAKSA